MIVANRVIGIGLLLLSVYAWLAANTFPASMGQGPGPDFFPKMSAVILGILAIMLVFKKEETEGKVYAFHGRSSVRSFILAFIAIIFYVILIEFIGFGVSTVLVSLAWMWLMGVRKWTTLIGASLIISAGISIIFEYLLGVPIPHGILY